MKKLTKRVQAGGLWFDVPASARWLCVDSDGELKVSYYDKDKPFSSDSDFWIGASSICVHVDLDGADWRNCCWYVGDQVEGEAIERREWMALGADAVRYHHRKVRSSSSTDCMRIKHWWASFIANVISNKIRAGKIG